MALPTDHLADDHDPGPAHVSTGDLPRHDAVSALVDEAHRRFAPVDDGAPSDVYPALANADRDLFGVCIVDVEGRAHAVGDAEVAFPIMSVAKPFVFALVCDTHGTTGAARRLGVNATGLAFNDIAALDRQSDGRTNPLVNPGAIATASLVPGEDHEDRWRLVVEGLSRFAGRTLVLNDEVYASARDTNLTNRALTAALAERGALAGDPAEALDLYTRECCLQVTARDLAVMGATLADGGVNPVTGDAVVSPETCRAVLTVMTTAGLYETSGDWLYEVGLPGKSGIGGGIVTVSPGKGAVGTFAPPLDAAGNSVRGQLVAQFLSRRLGMDLFASEARGDASG